MAANYEVIKFIRLIKKCPSIWNHKSSSYGKKSVLNLEWTTVCAGMVFDFGARNSCEKNNIVSRYKSKWQSLRRKYLKYRQYDDSNSKPKSKFSFYYKELRYLDDLYEYDSSLRYKLFNNSLTKNLHTIKRSLRHKARLEILAVVEQYSDQSNSEFNNNNNIALRDRNDTVVRGKAFHTYLLQLFQNIPQEQCTKAKEEITNVVTKYTDLSQCNVATASHVAEGRNEENSTPLAIGEPLHYENFYDFEFEIGEGFLSTELGIGDYGASQFTLPTYYEPHSAMESELLNNQQVDCNQVLGEPHTTTPNDGRYSESYLKSYVRHDPLLPIGEEEIVTEHKSFFELLTREAVEESLTMIQCPFEHSMVKELLDNVFISE